MDYWVRKRAEVLQEIKPICEALGAFSTQTKNIIKRYWKEAEDEKTKKQTRRVKDEL